MGHTLIEKIILAHADADEVVPGDVVMVRCDRSEERRVGKECRL